MKQLNIREIEYSLYRLDGDFKIIEVDDSFESLTGYTKEDVKTGNLYQEILIPEEDRKNYFKLIEEKILMKQEAFVEHRVLRKNGEIIFVFCMGVLEANGFSTIRMTRMDNSLSYLFIKDSLKNKYKLKIKNIKKIADHDNLTNLLRRDPFITNVEKNMNEDSAMILIDVDNFKKINDTYGHIVGDKILVEVSNILKNSIRNTDFICRLGGDEFAIFVTGIESTSSLENIAEKLLNKVNNISIKEDINFHPTLSIGIKKYDESTNSFNKLYSLADEALYYSKENGKNRYTIHD